MNNQSGPPGGRQERRGDENRPNGIYGDHLKRKRSGMVRILFQNPQGLGRLAGGSSAQTPKLTKLRDTLIKHDKDIVGLAEINKDWRKIPQKDSMWQMTQGWFENRRLNTSINTMVPSYSQTQFGGTLLMIMNKYSYSIFASEGDERKLGRWATFVLHGKIKRHAELYVHIAHAKAPALPLHTPHKW
jgi:hypothetical protein